MSWNFIEHFNQLGSVAVSFVLPFLFVLTIIVFVHELGHFLVARWCGIKVLVFSIGFGPEIVGFNDRHGTRWKICGDSARRLCEILRRRKCRQRPGRGRRRGDEHRRARGQLLPQAGRRPRGGGRGRADRKFPAWRSPSSPTIFMIYGKQETAARVDEVIPGSAAAAAGFKPGDLVLSINGTRDRQLQGHAGNRLAERGRDARFRRRARQRECLFARDAQAHRGKRQSSATSIASDCWACASRSRRRTSRPVRSGRSAPSGRPSSRPGSWSIRRSPIWANWRSAALPPISSADPLRIAQMSGQAASLGFSTLMNWAGLISVSIGLLNLFPIPLLDGGHLLFYAIEAVRGRPLPERVQEVGFRIGLALIVHVDDLYGME